MKGKKIYLSLPISGYDIEERRATAQRAEDRLTAIGHTVVNPLKNGLPVESPTCQHMKRDIGLLLGCDAIFLMERWTHSAGCMTELHVATAIGIDVYFEECLQAESIKFK